MFKLVGFVGMEAAIFVAPDPTARALFGRIQRLKRDDVIGRFAARDELYNLFVGCGRDLISLFLRLRTKSSRNGRG